MINKSPAIFNLSMITAGDPSSSSAQYSAAWSATIINSASVVVSGIGDNLDNGFRDGTTNSTTYAMSINNEAPASTSVGSSSTSSSYSISPTQISDSSFGTITQSTSTSTSTPFPSATLTSGPARRSRLRRAKISPKSPIQRRALAASNALLIAASAGSSSETQTTSTHADSNSLSLPGMKQAASAASFVEEPDAENITFVPLSSTSTQTSFSSSATSVTGVPNPTNMNTSDPLSNVPDVPLQTTASLFAMSLQEGAWANNRAAFLPFISQHHPDIYQKYFGNGTTGDGILGKRWTHILLLVTVKADSAEIETSEVVGMVYGVVPGLTPVQGSSADGDSVSVSNTSDEESDDSSSTTSGFDSSIGQGTSEKDSDSEDDQSGRR
ncbi:hypothetical protein FB446DRAFT_414891 [Lentinula raphanica]|nr:hypothetical protein FB446DRAFT_414891 [Lentinula raphanica]